MSDPRILVLRGGAIGDFVLTLPVFQALRVEWPEVEIDVVGYPRIANLAQRAGLVSKVRSLDEAWVAQLFIPGAELPPAEKTYIQRFDFIISYLYDPDELLKNNLVSNGAKQVISGSHRREDVTPHAIDFFMKPLSEFAIYPFNDVPVLGTCESPGEQRLILHPGSGSPFKNWPLDRYIQLASRWMERHGPVNVILGEVEQGFATHIREVAPELNLIEGLELTELAVELQRHDLYLGNDTGISHLAAACGLPVTVLFGGTNPAIWAPRGPKVDVIRGASLHALDVDEVYQKLCGCL